MLRLVEFEAEKLEAIKRLQNELEAMLPVFEDAADLIRCELEPFRKYGREPYVNVSMKNGLIQLHVTVQKRTAKSVSFNWGAVSEVKPHAAIKLRDSSRRSAMSLYRSPMASSDTKPIFH